MLQDSTSGNLHNDWGSLRARSKSRRLQQDEAYVGGVAVADTHRVEPKLDNGGIVELVNLAAHRDEAVAVLNLFDVLLPRRLCCYFTQHCLGGHGKGAAVGGAGRRKAVKTKGWIRERGIKKKRERKGSRERNYIMAIRQF